jgi:hypothetical protein
MSAVLKREAERSPRALYTRDSLDYFLIPSVSYHSLCKQYIYIYIYTRDSNTAGHILGKMGDWTFGGGAMNSCRGFLRYFCRSRNTSQPLTRILEENKEHSSAHVNLVYDFWRKILRSSCKKRSNEGRKRFI